MSDEPAIDHSEIESALTSIGLSAALIFGATLLSQGLGFVTRITMAQYLPVDGYGNVVLGISMLNLLGIAVLAGLPQALSRYIPRQDTDEERREIVVSAFQIVGVFSLITASVIYLIAEPISTILFGTDDLVWIFRVFAGVLPFYAMFKLSIGGFRGYEQTKPQVVTDKALLPGLQLAGIVLFVTLGYDTVGIAFAYAVAFSLVGLLGILIVYRIGTFSVRDVVGSVSTSRHRELLAFSIPLAASGAINVIAKHSDLIILGIFKSSSSVGIYEVAFRMSMFVVFFFSPAIGYLFQPLMSKFDADDQREKMDQLYTVTTRWIVVATFPLFALLILFPEQTLSFFFGPEYGEGQLALAILVAGFMVSRLPGLTGSFLTATGRTNVLLYISVATAILNILVNVALIPIYGIVGAAIATAGARVFNNAVQSYVIIREFDIHPFERDFVLPTVTMGAILLTVYIAPIQYEEFNFVEGFLVSSILGAVYLAVLLVTRSVYQVELELIDSVFEQVGIPVTASRILKVFVR